MKIELCEYDPEWPKQFQEIKTKLLGAIEHLNPVIEHVGSTSVSGLLAKPTIDIQIGMPSEQTLNELHENLLLNGFTRNARWDSNLPFRRFFVLLGQREGGPLPPQVIGPEFKGDVRSDWISLANIHCVEQSHQWFADHLMFRDYLRAHPKDREAYGELKLKLAKEDWNITADYAEAKGVFIDSIKVKARAWLTSQES